MSHKAPGKSFRKGISLIEIMQIFPDNVTAEAWFAETRWPNGPACPHCGSTHALSGAAHKTMPYRCREKGCRKRFSVKTGTIMEASNISYQKWAIGMYLCLTNLKSVSSMKLHRDLDITQRSAWHMAHRLRRAFAEGGGIFSGPVEVDESYFGGRESNKHESKKRRAGRGTAGKTAVAGLRDRPTGQVKAKVVSDARAKTLQDFVAAHTERGATVYTDDAKAYRGMPNRKHEAVKHSTGEYVSGMASTNGIESFWAMLKRAHKGTFHKLSPKHLDRYVQEFVGKHNMRDSDTSEQMRGLVERMDGKRLQYRDLIADNGLASGARA